MVCGYVMRVREPQTVFFVCYHKGKLRARIDVTNGASLYLLTYLLTYVLTYLLTYLLTCLLTYLLACLLIYSRTDLLIYTQVSACMRRRSHACIHTSMCIHVRQSIDPETPGCP